MNLIKGIRRILIALWIVWAISWFVMFAFLSAKTPSLLEFLKWWLPFQIPPLVIYVLTMWVLKGFVKDK